MNICSGRCWAVTIVFVSWRVLPCEFLLCSCEKGEMESHRQLASNLLVVLNAHMRSLKLELTPVAKIIWSLPAEKCSWRTSVQFSKEPSLTENRQLKNKRSLSVFSSDKPIQTVTPLSPSCYKRTSGRNTACRNARAGLGRSTGTNCPSRCSRWRSFSLFLWERIWNVGDMNLLWWF